MSVASRRAVFISGQGSNLKALLDAYPNEQCYVFSNKMCKGLLWAKKRGFVTEVISLKNSDQWTQFSKKIKNLKLSSIYLLGFMKLIPESFLKSCGSECINIHPSVLPDFKGLKAIEKSFESKKAMGCTLHLVTPLMDAGEVLLQKNITNEVLDLNLKNENDFSQRVHAFEQRTVCHQFEVSRGFYG